jgi:hypothetical protein
MPGEDPEIVGDQDRIGEAKRLNALGNLLDLSAGMAPRVA